MTIHDHQNRFIFNFQEPALQPCIMNNPDGMFKGASNGASEPEVSKPSNPAKPTPAPEPMVVDEPSGPKAEAKQEKVLGNAAYKAKNFDVALEHYDKAIALDDTDISFITNKAAVFFEKGLWQATMGYRHLCL